MHDIKDLETQWKVYQKRKKRPYYILGLLTPLVMAGAYYGYTQYTDKFYSFLNLHDETQTSTKKLDKYTDIKTNFLLNDAIADIDEIDSKKMDEQQKIEPIDIPTLPVIDNIPVIDKPKIMPIQTSKRVYKKPLEKVVKKRVQFHLTQTSSNQAYKEVEKRFYQFKDPDDSLFLAKVYYEKGAYKQAESWALQTNKLNNHIEESWIIFAKSKVKQGKIDDAIHILQTYIEQSHSHAAKILLSKIMR